jgi:hypothetical protein
MVKLLSVYRVLVAVYKKGRWEATKKPPVAIQAVEWRILGIEWRISVMQVLWLEWDQLAM